MSINIDDLVYVPNGKYKGYVLKITGIKNTSNVRKYNAEHTEFNNVKVLLDQLLGSVSANKNINYNENSNLNNDIEKNDLVYIPNGKYEGYVLLVKSLKKGHYHASEIETNNGVLQNIKVISDKLLATIH